MRNRHDGGGGPSGWGDDLPPKVRARFGTRPAERMAPGDSRPASPRPAEPPAPRPAAREWSRLAIVFLAVAAANVVVLLLALAFLDGRPAPLFLMPGR